MCLEYAFLLNDVESLSGVGPADKSLEGRWRIEHPGDDEGICSSYNDFFLPMYEIVFHKIHIKLSFTSLEVRLMCHLQIATSYTLKLGSR